MKEWIIGAGSGLIIGFLAGKWHLRRTVRRLSGRRIDDPIFKQRD